jgi:5-methylcytosine-specific restriction endonuclease McrA
MKTTYKSKDLDSLHNVPVKAYFYSTRFKRIYQKIKKNSLLWDCCICRDVVTNEKIELSTNQLCVVIQGELSDDIMDYINFHNYFKVTEKEEVEEEKVELTNEEIKFLKKAIEISKK